MKILLFLITLSLISFSPIFAESLDPVIVSNGVEYEIAEITKEYYLNKNSHIKKAEGFTTTGEMFFLRVSDISDFQKVMLLDNSGRWQKAELKEKVTETVEPIISTIIEQKTDLHFLTDQYDRVYNKAVYKLSVKTFDKSIYSGNNFDQFQGKISGAKVVSIISDPNGEIKHDFEGFVENGLYEGSVIVPENLWQKGWYTVDVLIEFEGIFYYEQLAFYVYGEVSQNDGCTKVNGVCI